MTSYIIVCIVFYIIRCLWKEVCLAGSTSFGELSSHLCCPRPIYITVLKGIGSQNFYCVI